MSEPLRNTLAPLFSRGKDDWRTPSALFQGWDDVFHFTIDLAADEKNHLCPKWFGPGATQVDALAATWGDHVGWCNPPYSHVKEFVAKAVAEQVHATTVMLIPARTDTRWFHEYLYNREFGTWRRSITCHFLKGRVKFLNERGEMPSASAPFPSMMVVFSGSYK